MKNATAAVSLYSITYTWPCLCLLVFPVLSIFNGWRYWHHQTVIHWIGMPFPLLALSLRSNRISAFLHLTFLFSFSSLAPVCRARYRCRSWRHVLSWLNPSMPCILFVLHYFSCKSNSRRIFNVKQSVNKLTFRAIFRHSLMDTFEWMGKLLAVPVISKCMHTAVGAREKSGRIDAKCATIFSKAKLLRNAHDTADLCVHVNFGGYKL